MIKRKKTNMLVRDITFPLTPYQIKSKKITKVTEDLSSRLIKCLLNTSVWISRRHLKFNVYLRKCNSFGQKCQTSFLTLPSCQQILLTLPKNDQNLFFPTTSSHRLHPSYIISCLKFTTAP